MGELAARNLDCLGKRPELQERPTELLQGKQRSLSLLFRTPTDQPEEHNLEEYEAFTSEGLHNMKEHIKNVFNELPAHLDGEVKNTFQHFMCVEIESRGTVCGSDYSRAAVKLPVSLRGKVALSVLQLVETLAELSLLLYMMEANRTLRSVLCLYNVAFLHGLLCQRVLFPTKEISHTLLFGLYYHNITTHSGEDT